MANSVGSSRGFIAPVSLPISQQPPVAKQASNTSAPEPPLQLNAQGPVGRVINTKA
jgi:hypothetical protein